MFFSELYKLLLKRLKILCRRAAGAYLEAARAIKGISAGSETPQETYLDLFWLALRSLLEFAKRMWAFASELGPDSRSCWYGKGINEVSRSVSYRLWLCSSQD
jgi:hypothetical protein